MCNDVVPVRKARWLPHVSYRKDEGIEGVMLVDGFGETGSYCSLLLAV